MRQGDRGRDLIRQSKNEVPDVFDGYRTDKETQNMSSQTTEFWSVTLLNISV
jgi:hypothetical protein